MDELTLTSDQIENLAESLRFGEHLNFTNLKNKNAVKKRCTAKGIRTYSRTAHGSLLDPRYTVEGSHMPDRGFANDYKHFTPKLYCLESSRW